MDDTSLTPSTNPPLEPSPRKNSPELRLTVAESVYYQQPGIDALHVEAGYSYFVQNNEQVFQRIALADEQWKPIQLGWLESVSCIIIQNRYETPTQVNLSEEEKALHDKHIIEVRFSDSAYVMPLRPKESMRFRTYNPKQVFIRSAFGITRYISTAIPE